jgi:hypothetical protein
MKPLELSLVPLKAIRLASEPTIIALVLRNPNPDSVETPLPVGTWWQGAQLVLTRPDGSSAAFQLGADGPTSHRPRLTLFEEAELSTSFTLEGRVERTGAPGRYALRGQLATGDGSLRIEEVRWDVEDVRTMHAVVAPPRAVQEDDEIDCWTIERGARRAALSMCSVGLNDVSSRERVGLSPPQPWTDVGLDAHGLVAMQATADPTVVSPLWVAWLEASRLHAGFRSGSFRGTSIELPGVPARILPGLLPDGASGADALILGAESGEIWHIRLRALKQADAEAGPSGDEDDDDAPTVPTEIPVAALLATYRAPATCVQGAAVRSPVLTVIALLSQAGACIEVHYGRLDGEGRGAVWTAARIDNAALMPGADPALAIDDQGIGRVGVLYRTRGARPGVGVAVLAFDSEGRPLWADGTGREEHVTDSEAVAGALALLADPSTSAWVPHWGVALQDGRLLARSGPADPEEHASEHGLLLPLGMAVWPACSAFASRTAEGRLWFVA